MIFYFLIPTVFPNYLTGSKIFWWTVKIFYYKETKFQRSRVNSFFVADFQKADFRWCKDYFALFCSSLFTKITTAPRVFYDIGMQFATLYAQLTFLQIDVNGIVIVCPPKFFRAFQTKLKYIILADSTFSFSRPLKIFGGKI